MEQLAYLPPLLEILLGEQDLKSRLEEALRYVVNVYGFSLGLVVFFKAGPGHVFYQSPRLQPAIDPGRVGELFKGFSDIWDLRRLMEKNPEELFDLGLERMLERKDITFKLYPLVSEERVFGFLSLARETGLPELDEEEKTLLSIMVRQIVMELTREMVLVKERDLAGESASLLEVGRAIIAGLDLDEVCEHIIRVSMKQMGVERCGIHVLDEDGLMYTVMGSETDNEAIIAARKARLDPYFIGDVMKLILDGNTSVYIEDARTDPRTNNEFAKAINLVSALGVPLVSHGKAIGFIILYDDGRHRYFSDEDIRVMEGIAAYATIAIENARLYLNSREQQERLADLMLRLAQAREEERSRISRELHDSMAQTLLEIIYKAENLLAGEAGALLEEELRGMLSSSRSSLTELRRIITDLRPSSVEVLGLPQALHNLLERFAVTYSIKVDAEIDVDPGFRLDSLYENSLYRMAQEMLTNIARHAAAGRVDFLLRLEEGCLHLRVSDDGRGFDPSSAPGAESLGLVFMRERVEMMGGTIEVGSEPGKGTTLSVRVPLPVETEGGGTGLG